MSIVSNLIRKATKTDEQLNILSFFYDGRFDLELLNTGHHFYGCLDTSAYAWPGYKNAAYSNLHILNNLNEANDIDLDLIVFNSRPAHNKFFGLCRQMHVPGLIVDHDYNMQNNFFREKNKQHTPFTTVSCGETIQKQYDSQHNIEYGIGQNPGEYDKDIDILVTITPQSNPSLIGAIKQEFPSTVVIGNNQQIPYAGLVNTYEDYKGLFRRAKLFINLSPQLNINHDILYARKNRVPIITIGLPIYQGVLDCYNSIQVGNYEDIIPAIKNVVYNKDEYDKISHGGKNDFSQPQFISRWAELFTQLNNKAYIE